MKRRKFLLGSTAALAGASFVTGSGAFSSAEAERNVNIDVVGDEKAFLRLLYPDESQSIPCTGEINVVNVQNGTGSELTCVTVSIASSPENLSVDLNEERFSLDTDDQPKSITATTTQTQKGSFGDGRIDFHVTAKGDGISIQTTEPRSIDVEWDCPKEGGGNNGDGKIVKDSSVAFQQEGKRISFDTKLSGEVTVWFSDNDGIGSVSPSVNNTDKINKGSLNKNGSFDLIAVEVPNSSALFVSPYWNGEGLDSGFDGACKVESVENIADFLGNEDNFPVCERNL